MPLCVLDLFSGCGGISAGMQHAGMTLTDHIEFNKHPSAAHALGRHMSSTLEETG